ncbi:hypothetical protein M3Y98_00839200 [Aphelenchoides besseyi]|nr:hypothetical protein M3Y98_00839200 [Aphelenchoides besseyi]
MNLDHDLYDRVEKIYEDDQPQFYHCIRCNALLRYNSGGSYRRHFAICKVEDDDDMVTERAESFNENEDGINGDKPSGMSNESNGQIRLTRSRTAEKKTDRELIATSEVNRTKLLRLLIEWSIADLVPFRVFRSAAFRRVMDEHAEMIELQCGVKQSTSSNFSGSIGFDGNFNFAQEVEKHCYDINKTSQLDVVREINMNGCALTVELCRVDEVDFSLLTAYFFCKREDRWDLKSTIVNYTKWNQSKKLTKEALRSYCLESMKSMGIIDTVAENAFITFPYVVDTDKTVYCTSQLFESVARHLCAIEVMDISERLRAKLTDKMIESWKQIPELLSKVDELIDRSSSDSKLAELLASKTSKKSATHWLRQFDVMKSIVEKRDEVQILIDTLANDEKTPRNLLRDLDENHTLLKDLCRILDFIAKATRTQQTNSVSTLGRSIPILSRMIIDLRKLESQGQQLGMLAAIAIDELARQMPKIREEVEGVAAFLDPNTRRVLKVAQQQMGNGAWDYNQIKLWVCCEAVKLEALKEEDESPMKKKLKIEISSPDDSNDTDLFYGFDVGECQPEIEMEISEYEALPIRGGHVDVGVFWAERSTVFPQLSALASRFLCIQSSVVNTERNFDLRSAIEMQRQSEILNEQMTNLLEAKRSLKESCD